LPIEKIFLQFGETLGINKCLIFSREKKFKEYSQKFDILKKVLNGFRRGLYHSNEIVISFQRCQLVQKVGSNYEYISRLFCPNTYAQ